MSLLFYGLHLLLIVGLVSWMQRQDWASTLKPYFLPALVFKLLCGILLGLLYRYYYHSGDTITYYKASLVLTDYALQNPGAYSKLLLFNTFSSEAFRATVPFSKFPDFSNSFYFIKLLSALNLLTRSSYYLNALYLSLFSFWGAARLVASLQACFPKRGKAAAIAFLFFPSVVFWSSGLLKDALMFGSMCWLIFFALKITHGRKARAGQLILAPLMLYVFVRIKLFYAAVLIPLLLAYIFIKLVSRHTRMGESYAVQVGSFLFVLVLGALAGSLLGVFFSLDFLLSEMHRNYTSMLEVSRHGPHIVLERMGPGVEQSLLSYPEAALSAVYRPFLGEAWGALYVLMGLENLLLLVLTVLFFAAALRKGFQRPPLLHLVFLIFVLVLAGVVGLTTPNFGSLSRYRIVFLPFLVYLLLQNAYAQRVLQKLGL
ncbi:hypothetical protein CLV24_106163 [Pontibacter ummariensis]|uniref:Dolichyl-phosphate-mannose-protein mannosyltransferase n=1 Tax=Pontibacter ummariensis TaxID=1610492 RepID=A0A239EI74_9BACT|nr:hypothetical protein [Pontibacter ummariensis]PRY13248.1 hypothetical protein CLV24_106163 [Pontibacter ummariensis]SNS43733.1 hypothetical protein SAMN06296052_106163 [Pontibacter ummariensis]